ncbi:unnamed protein product [Pedinophyceae sp. YPF-701]|nr:unnamed protein product [Pedinophyceae sp. YPF-701]
MASMAACHQPLGRLLRPQSCSPSSGGRRALIRAPRARSTAAVRRLRAAADEETDVAVFRFTLGSEDIDNQVPRAVGLLGTAALFANHASSAIIAPSQSFAEAVGAVLAVMCVVAPAMERRLRDADPGRGRGKLSDDIAGSVQMFRLAPALSDATQQELAWSCFSFIRNTNACTALVYSAAGSGAVACRGAVGTEAVAGARDADAQLAALSQAVDAVLSKPGACGDAYLQDRTQMASAGAGQWPFVPTGVESVLIRGMPDGKGAIVLMSERPRAFSTKERAWTSAVAAKLAPAL